MGDFKILHICFVVFRQKNSNCLSKKPKDYKAKCGYRNQAPINYHSICYKWKHCATSSMTRMNVARTKEHDHWTLKPFPNCCLCHCGNCTSHQKNNNLWLLWPAFIQSESLVIRLSNVSSYRMTISLKNNERKSK